MLNEDRIRNTTINLYPDVFTRGPVKDRIKISENISLSSIRNIKDLAQMGGYSFGSEKSIAPFFIEDENGHKTMSYRYYIDPALKNLLTKEINNYAGFRTETTKFKGSDLCLIDNIYVIEEPLLVISRTINCDGKSFAWNLFVGDNAFYEDTSTLILYPSFKERTRTIENGIFHHFVEIPE